jgi:hypothetical protein
MTPTEIRRRACVRACDLHRRAGPDRAGHRAALYLRTPLKLDVIRDRGSMGREVEDGMIENVYRLQIMNTSEQAHVYKIAVSGLDTLAQVTADRDGRATETKGYPVRLRTAHGAGKPGSNKIESADRSRRSVAARENPRSSCAALRSMTH